MIRVLIVDDISSTLDNLRKLLSFEDDIEVCGTANNGKQAIEKTRELNPDLVLMDVNMPTMDGIQATEILVQELPSSPVVIMSVQGERDYLRRAMQAGAREFLVKPFSGDELVAAIHRVHQLEQKKETFLNSRQNDSKDNTGTLLPRTDSGEVWLVFSGKGGVGKSILASNMAAALAVETGAKVGLADFDLQFGDIGVLLNLDHSRSITDLIEATPTLDEETLTEVMATGPGKMRVLLAPISPELADLITLEHVRSIITQLRKVYDYVVIDTPCTLNEINLELIESAQKVILVTTLTIPALKEAKLALKILDSLGVDSKNIFVTVNRTDAHSNFNKARVEQNLRWPVVAQLPYEPKVLSNSVNRGVPFVISQPEAEVSRAIRDLVSKLVPSEESQSHDLAEAPDETERKKTRRFGFGRNR